MKLTFDLKRGTLKAVFICPNREDLTYLIDTGADTPVWCKGETDVIIRDVYAQDEGDITHA